MTKTYEEIINLIENNKHITSKEIADHLNANGILTGFGNKWNANSVASCLCSKGWRRIRKDIFGETEWVFDEKLKRYQGKNKKQVIKPTNDHFEKDLQELMQNYIKAKRELVEFINR